jgi:hypothetical protein
MNQIKNYNIPTLDQKGKNRVPLGFNGIRG